MADRDTNDPGDDLGTFRPTRDGGEPPTRNSRAPKPRQQGPGQAAPLPSRQEPAWTPAPPRPVDTASTLHPSHPPAPTSRTPEDFIAPAPLRPTQGAAPHEQLSDREQLPRIARTGPARSATGRPIAAAPAQHASAQPAFTGAPRPLPPPPPPQGQRHDDSDEDEHDQPGRNWLKFIGIATLSLTAVAGALAAAVFVYTPVDLVRDRLIREVKAKTGRDLVIGGRPVVSFWPNVAVSLGNVTLSNPPGMAGPPLIEMQRLDATIQLWPLLQQRVQVDQLVLQSPRIALSVDGQGRRNWDFADALPAQFRLTQYAQASKLEFDQLPDDLRDFARGSGSQKSASTTTANGISLGRVRIVDGAVRHFDERSGLADEATGIDLTVDAPDLAGPLQAAGSLKWRGEAIRIDTRVMPASALLSGATAQTTAAMGSGPLQLIYNGSFTAPRGGAPRIAGQLTAKSDSIAKVANWLGHTVIGDAATGPLNFKGRIALGGTKAGFADAALQVQGLNLTGALELESAGARPKLTGAIRLAEFNPDALAKVRVMPGAPRKALPSTTNATPQSIEDLLKEPTSAKPQVRGFTARDGWGETPLDLGNLAMVDADVKVALNRIAVANVQAGPGHITVTLAERVLKLTVEDMTLHEGKVRGIVTIDGATPRMATSVNLVLDGIAMQPLLKEAGSDGLDGKAKITVVLTGAGRTERQVVDSLTGKAEILMARGAFIGHDVSAMVRGITQGRMPQWERDPAARTEFTDLGASFVIAKGVADNRDFRIVARDVRAIGNGQIALGPRTIDFTVRPKLLSAGQAPAGLGGTGINLANIDIPIRITGPLDKPKISADLGQALKDPAAIVDAVKKLNTDEVQETVKGLLKGDDTSKAKAKDFLNNLLKR
jgi:AsmA protein